jgi:predicted esterase
MSCAFNAREQQRCPATQLIWVLHVHGDADQVVPLEENSGELARRYRALGGQVRLIVIPGKGHEVCPEFFQCQELVDFVIAHAKPRGPAA